MSEQEGSCLYRYRDDIHLHIIIFIVKIARRKDNVLTRYQKNCGGEVKLCVHGVYVCVCVCVMYWEGLFYMY